MRSREKFVIVLYTVLGLLLAVIGFSVIWMTNTGMITGSQYLRYGVFGLGIFLLVIGVHLLIVGVNSLRGS